jgi:hypothetical protein
LLLCAEFQEKQRVIGDSMNITYKISYALVAFGNVPKLDGKLFAVPWSALVLDANRHRFLLHITAGMLKNAPGFDQEHWPSMIDPTWIKNLDNFYGTTAHGS